MTGLTTVLNQVLLSGVPFGQLSCSLIVLCSKPQGSNPGQDMVGFSETQPARSSLANFQCVR